MLVLRDDLNKVWDASQATVITVLANYALICIIVSIIATTLAHDGKAALALGCAVIVLRLAAVIIYIVTKCADITNSVMSTSNGLHGELIMLSSQYHSDGPHTKDAISLLQLQHILMVSKMGAKLGVVVDWTLLATVIGSTAATLLSTVSAAYAQLNSSSPMPLHNVTY